MNFLVEIILPYLLIYKYYAIFFITFIAALAFPIPPGTLLMASSAFASQGYLNFWFIVLFGSLGNILGDNVGYFLARKYGKEVLSKIGFKRFINGKQYANLEAKMLKRPALIIFVSRFEVLSNLCVNLLSGLSRVPYRTYLLFDTLGEFAQVFIYCSIGYMVGDNWGIISNLISNSLLFILLIAIVILVLFRKRIFKKNNA
ncbi:MAG: DedA family protein [Candidatus Pacebacteria bacterium]|nr:DedA family protein [Candidatus Paceibacterota bacterium]